VKSWGSRVACSALALGYLCLAWSIANAPMQDVPEHLGRAHIISDLLFDDGSVYGRYFQLQMSFRPYLAGDLLLALLDHYVGTIWAARLLIGAAIVLIPLGARFALKSLQLPRVAVLAGTALSLYVATGWSFVMGFFNYQIAMACALFAYGWFLRAQESSERSVWLSYAMLVLVSYAMHLSGLVFICAFVGISALLRVLQGRTSLWRAAALLAVPCALLILHICIGEKSSPEGWRPGWGSLYTKLIDLFAPARRFGNVVDLGLFAGFLGVMLFPLFTEPLRNALQSLSLWLCAFGFAALYFALPANAQSIAFVDIRALPYALLFLMFAGVKAASRSAVLMRWQFATATLMVAANLAYVAAIMEPEDNDLGLYRAIAAQAPADARVLPINTRPPIGGRYRPFQHAGAYATLDAHAWTPYLFAADANPAMSYFTYVGGRGDAPEEFWYENALSPAGQLGAGAGQPDWRRIEKSFQYLLVTVPWDPALIPSTYAVAARNGVAALLQIPQP
jgi:hypothetical protein